MSKAAVIELALAALALAAIVSPSKTAAEPSEALQQAEEAYLDVNMERVLELASRALEQGGHSVEETARIYELIGTAAATLRQEARAKEAYKKMMAIDPNVSLNESLPPRLRGPFLEARGYWSAGSKEMEAEVGLGGDEADQLAIALVDPVRLIDEVEVSVRGPDSEGFDTRTLGAEPMIRTSLEGYVDEAWVEYSLRALDEHGNAVLRVASTQRPERLVRFDPEQLAERDDATIFQSPWFWVVTGAVVAGGLAVGGYFLLRDDSVQGRGGLEFGF